MNSTPPPSQPNKYWYPLSALYYFPTLTESSKFDPAKNVKTWIDPYLVDLSQVSNYGGPGKVIGDFVLYDGLFTVIVPLADAGVANIPPKGYTASHALSAYPTPSRALLSNEKLAKNPGDNFMDGVMRTDIQPPVASTSISDLSVQLSDLKAYLVSKLGA
jgi:hypothetical protein